MTKVEDIKKSDLTDEEMEMMMTNYTIIKGYTMRDCIKCIDLACKRGAYNAGEIKFVSEVVEQINDRLKLDVERIVMKRGVPTTKISDEIIINGNQGDNKNLETIKEDVEEKHTNKSTIDKKPDVKQVRAKRKTKFVQQSDIEETEKDNNQSDEERSTQESEGDKGSEREINPGMEGDV